ncbi:betaCop [Ecytonucleospora hepatopenaei]|uniref:BetaCop n=1 Tax=Ecytonucleospora hepatopenaei TaxID=646526 RepID=A0A1W0E9J9_9MICR|nr:betaCop [Ecytonucleospora hepatopenaei]
MSQTLYLQVNEDQPDNKSISKHPEKALKFLISQQTQGLFNKDLLHNVITSVMNTNDNKLKRLLYYYFETIMSDPSFVMCVNQINKDLTSPNEFVRGFALKLAAKYENFDYVNSSAIKENLSHKHYYVRLNALRCYTELSLRFGWDIENDLIEMLNLETNAKVQAYIFSCMFKLNISFDDFINMHTGNEVLDYLVDVVNDSQFLHNCINHGSKKIVFKAMCRLLERGEKVNISLLISILEGESVFKKDFERYLKYLSGESILFLHLMEPYEITFSFALLDHVISVVKTQDVVKVSEIIYNKYKTLVNNSEQRKSFKCGLIDRFSKFVDAHCISNREMLDSILDDLLIENDPEVLFALVKCLKILEGNNLVKDDKITKAMLKAIDCVRYGKILRFIFDILFININEKTLYILCKQLMNNFESQNDVFYLSEDPDVFLGGYISYSLVRMFKKIKFESTESKKTHKEMIAAICIKFIQFGTKFNLIDSSTHSSITLFLRFLLDESKKNVDFEDSRVTVKFESSLNVPKIPLLDIHKNEKKFVVQEENDTKTRTIQLSGLGDPLYVECNLFYTKYECVLDLLIINQTEFYLPEFSIDFTHSKHLKLIETMYPVGIQPSSAITQKISFSIVESSDSFITAALLFRYPRNGEYLLKPYVQHLNEIKLKIGDFLEKTSTQIDFPYIWKSLEWENIYSLQANIENMEECIDLLVQSVEGTIVNKESVYNFLVCNFLCSTIQKTLVLVNVCLSENKNAVIRVRSKDESIVKSISNLLGGVIKEKLLK